MLHRDLKPANVMIDGDGNVRITDFGIATAGGDAGTAAVGTPQYMAPELLAGKPASIQSDIYALGLVLFEIFTGRRAYDAKSLGDLKQLHDTGTVTTPSSIVRDLDPAIERLILRCLDKDPDKRPGSALAVAAALPGGDPLAAALAAGETPSPAMLVAAGESEALSVGRGLAGARARRRRPLRDPRRDLAEDDRRRTLAARQAAGGAGRSRAADPGDRSATPTPIADSAYGFAIAPGVPALDRRAPIATRSAGTACGRAAVGGHAVVPHQPAPARAARSSPLVATERSADGGVRHAVGPARLDRAADRVPGGAAAGQRRTKRAAAGAADGEPLFDAAGLDMSTFTPVHAAMVAARLRRHARGLGGAADRPSRLSRAGRGRRVSRPSDLDVAARPVVGPTRMAPIARSTSQSRAERHRHRS